MGFRPIIIDTGLLSQLPAGEPLDGGGWTLPTTGGTEDYVLMADASGNAIWAPIATAASNYPDPTDANQVLFSSAVDTAAWVTAGSDQVVASNGAGVIQFQDKPFAWDIPSEANAARTLVTTGPGSAWYETMLADLLVQAPVSGDSGQVLMVSGSGAAYSSATSLTDLLVTAPSAGDDGKMLKADAAGKLQFVAAPIAMPAPAEAEQLLISTAVDAAAWQTPGVNKVVVTDGAGALTFDSKPFGYNLDSPTVSDQTLVSSAAGAASWQTLGTNVVYTTNGSGVATFEAKPPSWTWTSPADAGRVFVSTGVAVTSWQVNVLKDVQTTPLAGNDGKVLQADASGYAQWTTDLTTLTSLGVDNITIDAAAITSDTGAISFVDDNLSTTGSLAVGAATAREQLEIVSTTGGIVQVSRDDLYPAATDVFGSYQYYTNDDSANASGVTAALRYICDGVWNGANNQGHWGVFVQDVDTSVSTLIEQLRVHNTGEVEIVNGPLTLPSSPAHFTQGGGALSQHGMINWGTSSSSAGDGTCIIDFPDAFVGAMISLKIMGYSYTVGGGPWELLIGGYSFNPASAKTWARTKAVVHGNPDFDSVRLGYNGNTGKACVMLGDTSMEWSFPQIAVQDMLVGYSEAHYQGDWAISFTTDETNFYNNDPTYSDPVTLDWYRDYPVPTEIGQTLISTAEKVADWQTARILLTANKQYWVDPTGNDTTGDGSEATPFATLPRIFEELDKVAIGDNTVWVTINAGHYAQTSRLKFQHPEGGKVTFDGDSETVTSQSTTSIGSTEYDLTTVTGDLDYIEVTITLTGKTLAVGDYILIYNATSGTNPEALQGCHKVETWASDIATIRIVYKAGVTLPSGTINFDCELVRTVFDFTGANGIEADGPFHLGQWKSMVFSGDPNDADCDYGLWLDNSAAITLSATTGVRGWGIGVLARYGATINANGAFVSCNSIYGLESVNGSAIVCQAAYVSGCNNSSIYAYIGGTINANGAKITGSGQNVIRSSDGAAVYITNAVIKNCTNDILYSLANSVIRAEAEDVSATQVYYDSTATCSPVRDATGNFGAVMVGGPY